MTIPGWQFIDADGTFRLPEPQRSSALYFPLANEAGMVSSITPTLSGDAKIDHNTYLLLPTSIEDLHNSRAGRNFWVLVDGGHAWSAAGNGAEQNASRFSPAGDEVTLTAGFLWHTVTRRCLEMGLQSEITSFVPAGDDCVELMCITLTNIGERSLRLTLTAAIPIYGRSADNLRDHRHVTSLLHRTTCHTHGVLVRPTLSFDERGHTINRTTYAVLGAEADGTAPAGLFPTIEDFIGEGGTLDWPEAVIANKPAAKAGSTVDGYEALGGMRFQEMTLVPGEARSYILMLAILSEDEKPEDLLNHYGSGRCFADALEQTKAFWIDKVSALRFETGDARFDGWLKWVTLQPTLRRMMGNSFLPYHDYGRGGRGWRDLWQDILALLVMACDDVSGMLLGNFAGVRIDGSNATIIGSQPGEFKADRNEIARVWMDHGAWPLLTTRLYIDQSGDLAFLLREQTYFKDHHTFRCRQTDKQWVPEQGTQLKTEAGDICLGTVLEHLLVQHLTAFFNVGEHNTILMEGGDWNDALDMARRRGESVAFSALYAGNLRVLSELCLLLVGMGVQEVPLAVELLHLLDSLEKPVDYGSVPDKHRRLQAYFESVRHTVSGEKVSVMLVDLARDLTNKADWLTGHIRQSEWITSDEGFGWFNGYYDDDGMRVEGSHVDGVRMTLTGQVFALMGGIASDEQAWQIVRAADRYLYDETVSGYRLNTDFGGLLTNLGRAFGFAFGHKENGAMFSHMAVMYAYALYRRGMVKEGWKVLKGIYDQSQDFARSRMYPGIPEYFTDRGRGAYPYLTGSASWYLLTLLTEAYGIKGELGNLTLEPKLTAGQFDAQGRAVVHTLFAGKRLTIIFENPNRLEYGSYAIERIGVNGRDLSPETKSARVVISRATIAALPDQVEIIVTVA